MGQQYHIGIVDLLRNYHYTNFSACLDGIRITDSFKTVGDFFKLLQSGSVGFQCFSSGTRPRCRNGIGCLHNARDQARRLNIAVVGFHRIDHDRGFLVLAAQLGSELHMRAFHLMVHRLADIMQESCALRHADIQSQLPGQNA